MILFNSTFKSVKEQPEKVMMLRECTSSIVVKGGVYGAEDELLKSNRGNVVDDTFNATIS